MHGERGRRGRIFGADDSLTRYGTPVRFGSRTEMMAGFVRAIAPPVAHRSCGLASLPTVFTAWHGDYISALNTIRAVPAAA